MNKNIIMASVLFLLIGFGAGYLYFKKDVPSSTSLNTQNEVATTDEKKEIQSNQFSKLFDPLKFGNETGHTRINDIEEDLGLLVIGYTTSPESSEYAVYDYKNDKLYKDIGYSGLGESISILSFVNQNQVLTYTYNEEGKGTYLLNVVDFIAKTTKELPIKLESSNKVEAGLNNGIVNIFIHKNPGVTEIYNLKPQTLELTKTR